MLNFLEQRYWRERKVVVWKGLDNVWDSLWPELGNVNEDELDESLRRWAAQERELARVDWGKEFEGVGGWTGVIDES